MTLPGDRPLPNMDDSSRFLYLSALQHYAYCPRQFALIHTEQVWEDNRFTAEGNLLHERVDSGVSEQRRKVRFERGVLLESTKYRLKGKMDLLEIEQSDPHKYFPVEYKRGKPKVEDWDRIQLCAQALCLEEMRNTVIHEGALWYWEVRRREPVIIDDSLRRVTQETIVAAHQMLASCETPLPLVDKKRCRACSLKNLCTPDTFRKDQTRIYVSELFEI